MDEKYGYQNTFKSSTLNCFKISNIDVKYCEWQFKIGFQLHVRQKYEKNECLKNRLVSNIIIIDISSANIQCSYCYNGNI